MTKILILTVYMYLPNPSNKAKENMRRDGCLRDGEREIEYIIAWEKESV